MLTLSELIDKAAGTAELEESVRVQIDQIREGRTQSDKPFFDLEVVDSSSRARFKIWSDTPAFAICEKSAAGDCFVLSGRFFSNAYGLNVNRPSLQTLAASELEEFFAGSTEQCRLHQENWDYLLSVFSGLLEKRLRALGLLALNGHEKKWRRAAAARSFHHARRGGLLEHTAQMLRCAQALAPLYAEVSPDLLYCGVLFHDVGKLWENDYPEHGFVSKPGRTGELLGHIAIGIEVANKCWTQAREQHPDLFAENVQPPSDLLRDHLLHLIASHHGTREFGSPVTPRTPEAWLLHHIDNIDAKIEMLRCTYREKEEVAPGLFEARRPLEGYAARPLSEWNQE